MSNTIEKTFRELERQKRPAFMPFFVAGFPNLNISLKTIELAAKYSNIIEIGVPYSDPLADGSTIQAAASAALSRGMNTKRTLVLVSTLRKRGVKTPIVLMLYANLIEQVGIEKFFRKAAHAGVDGVIIPDVPLEESVPFREAAKRQEVKFISLVGLATSKSRLRQIDAAGDGFLYLVSVLGTTGARKNVGFPCVMYLRKAKKLNLRLPICVGFGISDKKQAQTLVRAGSRGYIVGSTLVQFIHKNHSKTNFYKSFERLLKSFIIV